MGTAGVARSIELHGTELHGRQTKSCFLRFASGRLISTTAHLIGVQQRKLCWYVKFSQWKGQFWIQEGMLLKRGMGITSPLVCVDL